MSVINTTPHSVVIIDSDGNTITIKSSCVWRVKTHQTLVGNIDGIPMYIEDADGFDFGNVLPSKDGQYIVSRPMAAALTAAKVDGTFYVPSDLVRDKDGNVIGCRGLVLYR